MSFWQNISKHSKCHFIGVSKVPLIDPRKCEELESFLNRILLFPAGPGRDPTGTVNALTDRYGRSPAIVSKVGENGPFLLHEVSSPSYEFVVGNNERGEPEEDSLSKKANRVSNTSSKYLPR